MVVPSDGSSSLASVIRNHVSQRQARQRPQLVFGEMAGAMETPDLIPDDWTGPPFAWGDYAIANHMQVRSGDRVLIAWVGTFPVVVSRLAVPTMETLEPEPYDWWPVESGEFDLHVLDYQRLRADHDALRAEFDSHKGHP